MPLCPLVIALEMTVEFYDFLKACKVSFTKEKLPWCPCAFKNEAYRPVNSAMKFASVWVVGVTYIY